MTDPKTLILAGQTFVIPGLLPIRINRDVYPICRKLNNDGLIERSIQAMGALECTPEEYADLARIAFLTVKWVRPDLTREAFDDWPITPPELLDTYFTIRVLTGGWVENVAKPKDEAPGEAKRARAPRKSPRRT